MGGVLMFSLTYAVSRYGGVDWTRPQRRMPSDLHAQGILFQAERLGRQSGSAAEVRWYSVPATVCWPWRMEAGRPAAPSTRHATAGATKRNSATATASWFGDPLSNGPTASLHYEQYSPDGSTVAATTRACDSRPRSRAGAASAAGHETVGLAQAGQVEGLATPGTFSGRRAWAQAAPLQARHPTSS